MPCELLAAALALEQRQPKLFFQPLHLLGDGRLGALHGLGRRAECVVIGNRHKGAEQIEIEITHSLAALMGFRRALSGFQDRCSLQ